MANELTTFPLFDKLTDRQLILLLIHELIESKVEMRTVSELMVSSFRNSIPDGKERDQFEQTLSRRIAECRKEEVEQIQITALGIVNAQKPSVN
jgi:hypothetical protein